MKKTMKRLIITGVLIAASFCFLSPTQGSAATKWVSLNGVAVRSDRSADDFSYLGTGSAVAAVSGSLFGLAQIQLPHGATIQEIICTVKETNPSGGWIDVLLLRVPLDITDPSFGSTDIIASAFTDGPHADPGFVEIFDLADSNFAKVNNKLYGYFFRVDFINNPGTPGQNFELLGISVKLNVKGK